MARTGLRVLFGVRVSACLLVCVGVLFASAVRSRTTNNDRADSYYADSCNTRNSHHSILSSLMTRKLRHPRCADASCFSTFWVGFLMNTIVHMRMWNLNQTRWMRHTLKGGRRLLAPSNNSTANDSACGEAVFVFVMDIFLQRLCSNWNFQVDIEEE